MHIANSILLMAYVYLLFLIVLLRANAFHKQPLTTGIRTRVQSRARKIIRNPPIHPLIQPRRKLVFSLKDSLDQLFGSNNQQLPPLTQEDALSLGMFLRNVSTALETNPGHALTLVSQNMEWLLSRNIPKLTEEVLLKNPQDDGALGAAYAFLMDFLDAVTTETSELMNRNQKLMKSLFAKLKSSESELDKFISENAEELTSSEFLIYLQSEIENQEPQSEMHALLSTIHLRLLDENGKKWGVDVRALPRLAAEDNGILRKTKVLEHVKDYDTQSKQLFIQTIRMMLSELRKLYKDVDPGLIANLQDIERIVSDTM